MTLLCAIGNSAFGADTDGDGLLDLIDVPGFDLNAEVEVGFYNRGIEDLDDTNLLTNAIFLRLNLNRVTSIEQGDFHGLSILRSLELTNNQLTSIERTDFDGLSDLHWLYLGGNQLTGIDSGVFGDLVHLRDLFLYDNQITSIERGDFDGLNDLQRLHLSGNRIVSIESGDFDGLSNLPQLFFGGNQITSIETEDFDGLDKLRLLSLGGNPISGIESGAFRGLNDLHTLHLAGIGLAELNLSGATFDALVPYTPTMYGTFGFCIDSDVVATLRLDGAVLSEGSFRAIINETSSISDVSLVDLGFSDESPDNLNNLLTIATLRKVRVDQALFERYAAELNSFEAIPGNTVTVVPEPSAATLVPVGVTILAATIRASGARRPRPVPTSRDRI